ncbi:T3SS (YopN, CesT) and YbjN peptide-binding chaperone 1 [Raineyella sp. W15-4]|uniref:T3SS (YopN, CesT) and YbjN peptide-binding chaperone 1 n=1 Tax=Raineyella sp. W15-4 TaxID=3081651 RepID=UPI0029543A70|nr:YbjN domain-containing protein [Raineyella sp. W15-4]WOQ18488.1 hypothetical protein R0145_07405 [Raineyella sp. W15-4]
MPQYGDFDLDRSIAQAWDEFELRLAEVISVIDDSADFTIGCVAVDESQVPYVSFTALDRTTIRAEASSNAVLGEDYQLGSEQLALMERLGWSAPTIEGPRPTANFWIELDQEASDRLAAAAVGALRDVFGVQHPVFLAPDHLAEVLTPHPEPLSGATEFDAEDVIATIPVNTRHLNEMIETELTDMFGHAPLRDQEGDIALRVGSAMLFLRVSQDGRELILFSVIVHDVAGRSRAAEVLNDLNADARMVKFHLVRDKVFASLSVLTHPFVPAHLHQAVRIMSDIADGIDEELAHKLGGHTTFEVE